MCALLGFNSEYLLNPSVCPVRQYPSWRVGARMDILPPDLLRLPALCPSRPPTFPALGPAFY